MVHAGNSTKEVRQNAVASLSANHKGVLSNDMQKRTPSGLHYFHQLKATAVVSATILWCWSTRRRPQASPG